MKLGIRQALHRQVWPVGGRVSHCARAANSVDNQQLLYSLCYIEHRHIRALSYARLLLSFE